MELFRSLDIASSGMDVHQTWLDAIADNIANLNTVSSTDEPAFAERLIVARSNTVNGKPGGVRVAATEFGNELGRIVYDPGHPLADEEGFVRLPDMDLGDQMTSMLMAQRSYQANVVSFERARSAYETALEIGR